MAHIWCNVLVSFHASSVAVIPQFVARLVGLSLLKICETALLLLVSAGIV